MNLKIKCMTCRLRTLEQRYKYHALMESLSTWQCIMFFSLLGPRKGPQSLWRLFFLLLFLFLYLSLSLRLCQYATDRNWTLHRHLWPYSPEIHWLRVPERITFKLASLVFRCLNGTAPVHLADSITRAADVDTRRSLRLRSSSSTAVVVPVTRRSTIGDRAFPVAAARAWNSLPSFVTSVTSLLTFRRHLKTYLFATSY